MSETPQKSESSPTRALTPKDYLNPVKTLPATFKAAKEAWAAKGKGILERWSIFKNTFKREMMQISKEKKEVSKETQDKVDKSIENTLKDAKEAFKLNRSKVSAEDAKQFDETLAYGVKRLKGLDTDAQASFYTGLGKIDRSFKNESSEKMDEDEIAANGAVSIGLLIDLKKESENEKDLEKKLEKLYKTSKHSAYPMEKAMRFAVLNVFVNDDMGVQAALLTKLGLKVGAADLDVPGAGLLGSVASIAGIESGGDGKVLKEAFEGIKDNKLNGSQLTKAADALQQYFLPRTSQGNAEDLVRMINEFAMNKGKDYADPKTIAKIAYLVDTSDLNDLFNKFAK